MVGSEGNHPASVCHFPSTRPQYPMLDSKIATGNREIAIENLRLRLSPTCDHVSDCRVPDGVSRPPSERCAPCL